jgi:hypothetical protein
MPKGELKLTAAHVLRSLCDSDEYGGDYEHFLKFLMGNTSDREAILSAAAFFDDLMEERLRLHFSKTSDVSSKDIDFLLSKRPLPPLGTFGVKVVACRVLGLINESTRRSLNSLQELRNDAAHNWAQFVFTEDKAKVIQARLATRWPDFVDSMMGTLDGTETAEHSRARWRLIWTVACMLFDFVPGIVIEDFKPDPPYGQASPL